MVEVHFRFLGTNGFHAKAKRSAAGSRCRQNPKYEHFTPLQWKSVPHVQHHYFALIQPIKSLICGIVVAVAVVVS